MNPQEVAFFLQGKSIYIAAAASAPAAIQAPCDQQYTGNANATNNQYIITNYGAAGVIVAWGPTAAIAAANCVDPKSASAYSWPCLPSSKESITAPFGSFFTAKLQSGSTTADVYISPGVGL